MNSNPIQSLCDTCGTEVSSYSGVYFTKGNTRRFLCIRCYNESVSEAMGFDFEHLTFHPIVLADKDGENHTFHFQTRLLGYKVYIQAMEIRNNAPKGYEFSIYGNAEDDLFGLFTKLVERIRRELKQKHIEPGDLTRYIISDENIVRGRITWDDDAYGQIPCLVIDSKALSWHEFGRMLMAYEGFHFKLEIFGGDEER